MVIEVATLPAGKGVLTEEVGQPGPWYGVRLPDGEVYGWWRERAGAEAYAARSERAVDLPYATHSGFLDLPGGPTIQVHVLSDGTRVISAEDMAVAVEWLEGAKCSGR